MKTVDELRHACTEQQRDVLTAIWRYYLDKAKWPPRRVVHAQCGGKAIVRSACQRLGGSIVFDNRDQGAEIYQVTLLGVFLSDIGDEAERLLIRYFGWLRAATLEDPEMMQVDGKSVQAALGLSAEETRTLGELIMLGHIWGGVAGGGSAGWTAGVPHDVEDIPEDVTSYVPRRVSADYDPEMPYEETARQSYHGRARASAPRRADVPSLFFCYAHTDQEYRDRLERGLAMLKHEGLIETWHDRRIPPGAHVDHTISQHLDESDVILLLVSPDFLASPYCYDVETRRAVERQEAREATVIPVILRPCEWERAPFGRLNALPTDGKPISRWNDLDDAYLDVVRGIRRALEALHLAPGPSSAVPTVTAKRIPDARSSNLRVTRVFSEKDKDDFIRAAFEYAARFFENSADELARRNAGIEVRVRRIDAGRFTGVAYRGGDAASRCTVARGGRSGFGGGITYLADDSGATNALNEALSVDADEQSLYLRPFGMTGIGGTRAGEKLTLEGGAEFLWGLFVEPLQRRAGQ